MYKPTIGLEVHAELKTLSKMFCGCPNNPHASEVNTNICPVCLAHPGTLPVPNKTAIAHVLRFGTAVKGVISSYTEFDRKNYFYPDIPKAYQISQYAFPFVTGGEINGVALTRVHLEEDTARSQHDKGDFSLVDFNRAGVPLMELVTEPVITSAKQAGSFARELQLVLRSLGISDANMEKGEMRVEANISVSKTGERSKRYVEVKNLNSFRSVESAIEFEIKRQSELLEKGGELIQETRGWDEIKLQTFSQRSKETAKDYRYFPDPDIPKMDISKISDFSTANLLKEMPSLPSEKRLKYSYLGLTSNQIEIIIQSQLLDKYFLELFEIADGDNQVLSMAANYLVTDFLPQITTETQYHELLLPKHFFDLITLVVAKKITSRVAKDILIETTLNDMDVQKLISDRGLTSEFSDAALLGIVQSVVDLFPGPVIEYKAGKTTTIQFLIGQAMKQTKGAADPEKLKNLFETELS